MSQNTAVPKRKREDNSDGELAAEQATHRPPPSKKLIAHIHTPKRSESSTPLALPIPGSRRERLIKVNFTSSPIPKFNKLSFTELIGTRGNGLKIFMDAVARMREQRNLGPLGRFEMEALWWQKLDSHFEREKEPDKMLGLRGVATEVTRVGFKIFWLGKAWSQRGNLVTTEWWELQKSKYPELDVTWRHDNHESDLIQENVERWAAMVKDGLDPETQRPFSRVENKPMTLAEVNCIKITYEAAAQNAEAVKNSEVVKDTEMVKDTDVVKKPDISKNAASED